MYNNNYYKYECIKYNVQYYIPTTHIWRVCWTYHYNDMYTIGLRIHIILYAFTAHIRSACVADVTDLPNADILYTSGTLHCVYVREVGPRHYPIDSKNMLIFCKLIANWFLEFANKPLKYYKLKTITRGWLHTTPRFCVINLKKMSIFCKSIASNW